MKNAMQYIPTTALFGVGQLENLKPYLEGYHTVMITYGGNSIKRNGLYDSVKALLQDKKVVELPGIPSNPQVSKVREGIALCKQEGVEAIISVGGASVLDCSKAIALGYYSELDAWEMITSMNYPTQALPLFSIATIAAAGSDMTAGAVISNDETKEKLSLFSPLVFPVAAVLDPSYTVTAPAKQTAAGSVDILSHLMEQYFVKDLHMLMAEMVEGVMRTVIHYAPIAYKHPDDLEARSELLWASQLANNQSLAIGIDYTPFSCHGIEHELSAYYNITHGIGLAIVTPKWMRYELSADTQKAFARWARNVWHVVEEDDYKAALKGIEALESFYASLDMPTSCDIKDEDIPLMASHAYEHEMLQYAYVPLEIKDIEEILKRCKDEK